MNIWSSRRIISGGTGSIINSDGIEAAGKLPQLFSIFNQADIRIPLK